MMLTRSVPRRVYVTFYLRLSRIVETKARVYVCVCLFGFSGDFALPFLNERQFCKYHKAYFAYQCEEMINHVCHGTR